MTPRYKHDCPDWDFMELDENSAELVGCSCFSDPEFLAIRGGHSKELDRVNEGDTAVIHHSVEFSASGYDDQGTVVICTKEYWERMRARLRELEAALPTHRGCGSDCTLPAGHLGEHVPP